LEINGTIKGGKMITGTINLNSSATRRGVVRWCIRETMGIVMAGAILFLCAGRWDWLWGWATLFTLALWVGATALAVIPTNPALLAERTGPRKGAKPWDTAIMGIVGMIVLAIYVVGGLDVRNNWTTGFPMAAHVAGVIVTVLGYALVVWATASNAFFSQIVRIQKERGHAVATGGPYRFVRHPGYVGSIVAYVGTPIILGSGWAIVLGVGSAVLMIVRTAFEDKTLLQELNGYKDYATRVRYRLLPGVW
jgi:protein-S-isoprenylcysteine O-methyltransferase Ste14